MPTRPCPAALRRSMPSCPAAAALAAHAHDGPAFVLREMSAVQRPTAAPLRLGLRAGGAAVLAVHVLKRRGPPLEAPIRLELPPVLSEIARERAAAVAELHAATFV